MHPPTTPPTQPATDPDMAQQIRNLESWLTGPCRCTLWPQAGIFVPPKPMGCPDHDGPW